MLDNPITYDTSDLADNMIWEERISNWFGGWKDVFNLESVSETDSVLKIKNFIKVLPLDFKAAIKKVKIKEDTKKDNVWQK